MRKDLDQVKRVQAIRVPSSQGQLSGFVRGSNDVIAILTNEGQDDPSHQINAMAGGMIGGKSKFVFEESMPRQAYPGMMGDEWVAKFGVKGKPSPSTTYALRPWLDVRAVCSPNGLNIPVSEHYPHNNEGVLAGDMCPFCAAYARDKGFSYQWYLHQNDDNFPMNPVVKPEGFMNQYLHQVRKCARGVAMMHIACRDAQTKHLPSKEWMFDNVASPVKPAM